MHVETAGWAFIYWQCSLQSDEQEYHRIYFIDSLNRNINSLESNISVMCSRAEQVYKTRGRILRQWQRSLFPLPNSGMCGIGNLDEFIHTKSFQRPGQRTPFSSGQGSTCSRNCIYLRSSAWEHWILLRAVLV